MRAAAESQLVQPTAEELIADLNAGNRAYLGDIMPEDEQERMAARRYGSRLCASIPESGVDVVCLSS